MPLKSAKTMQLSEPSKKILELIALGKLRHGGYPILRWNASCLSTKESKWLPDVPAWKMWKQLTRYLYENGWKDTTLDYSGACRQALRLN